MSFQHNNNNNNNNLFIHFSYLYLYIWVTQYKTDKTFLGGANEFRKKDVMDYRECCFFTTAVGGLWKRRRTWASVTPPPGSELMSILSASDFMAWEVITLSMFIWSWIWFFQQHLHSVDRQGKNANPGICENLVPVGCLCSLSAHSQERAAIAWALCGKAWKWFKQRVWQLVWCCHSPHPHTSPSLPHFNTGWLTVYRTLWQLIQRLRNRIRENNLNIVPSPYLVHVMTSDWPVWSHDQRVVTCTDPGVIGSVRPYVRIKSWGW